MRSFRLARQGFVLALVLALAPLLLAAHDVPLPSKVQIAAPDSAIPAEVAAFSGKWVGEWGGRLHAVLVVQRIHPADKPGRYKVDALYAWGDAPSWYIRAGMREYDGEIKDGELVIEYGTTWLRFKLSEDRTSLAAGIRFSNRPESPGTFQKGA